MQPTPSSQGHRPLALIVDDDADTREMYALHLSNEGINTVEAHDSAQAFEKAKSFLPDVITTDLGRPQFSGVGLCRQLRSDASTRTSPVIAVTACAMPREIEKAMRAGCIAVLIKPCTPDTLLSEIRRVLETPAAPRLPQ
jgi:CheY-like chemotaxis protein